MFNAKPEYIKLLSLIRKANEIEDMVKSGNIDFKKLSKLLKEFGLDIKPEQLEELKNKFEETHDEDEVISQVAKLLNVDEMQIREAIELFMLLSSTKNINKG